MKPIKVFLLLLLTAQVATHTAHAQTPEQELCARSSDDFKTVALQSDSRIAFANHGGLFNGGVCWWHSRLQRAAIYLTVFRPDLPTPSDSEAFDMISHLVNMNQVVVIPGFRNFNDFTASYHNHIQEVLNNWQIADGASFGWVRGLEGSTRVSSNEMQSLMDQLYEKVMGQKDIQFEMLQLPGITSHAWLVVNMDRTSSGYDLHVIDSNYPGKTLTYSYATGDTNFSYGDTPFVPYVQLESDLEKILRAKSLYCGS